MIMIFQVGDLGLCGCPGQKVRLSCHNKVVYVQTVYLVCPPIYGDLSPFGLYGGMVVLSLRQIGYLVGKPERVTELDKVEVSDELFNAIMELSPPSRNAQR